MTHHDWLPNTAEESLYVETLARVAAAADDPTERFRIVREDLKPMLAQYGGPVSNVRGQILSIASTDAP